MVTFNDKETAARYRIAIKHFMDRHGVTVFSWTKKAGLRESTLRNFLNGDAESLTTRTLSRLARAANTSISEILGDTEFPGVNEFDISLLQECINAILHQAKEMNMIIPEADLARYATDLYEIAEADYKAGITQISIGAAKSILRGKGSAK